MKVWYEDPKPPTPVVVVSKPKPEPKEPPPPKEPVPPKEPPPPVVSTVTPAEFKVKDVVSKNIGTAMEYQHSYDLVEPMAYLYVKVVKARNLAAKDAGGTSDPVSVPALHSARNGMTWMSRFSQFFFRDDSNRSVSSSM